MKLSIVIPVYNEFPFIAELLFRVQQIKLDDVEKEIIIVDDYSTDGTRQLLEKIDSCQSNPTSRIKITNSDKEIDTANIKIFYKSKNQGKGAALRLGFREATGDVVLIQDADLEYDPNQYSRLLQPIKDGIADVVYGSRYLGGGPHRVLYFWHLVGNKLVTLFSNMLTNQSLTDMETCYKVFRREVLKDIEIKQNRFGFEPEITAKIAKKNLRVYEVPISYFGRTYAEGKKITWKDGIMALYYIVRYNLFN